MQGLKDVTKNADRPFKKMGLFGNFVCGERFGDSLHAIFCAPAAGRSWIWWSFEGGERTGGRVAASKCAKP